MIQIPIPSLVLAVLVPLLAGGGSWAGETRTGDSEDARPEPTPQPKDELESATNPSAISLFDVPVEDLLADLANQFVNAGYAAEPFEGDPEVEEGYAALPGFSLHQETLYGPVELTDLCFREVDPDIQSVYLDLSSQSNQVAKIRKFASDADPDGGTIYVTLKSDFINTVVSFPTTGTLLTLNQALRGAIQAAGFGVVDTGSFYVVSPPARSTIKRVGFRSTDPGLIISEIALEPSNFNNLTECSQ